MVKHDKLWWNNITGPASFRDAIVDMLLSRKNLILSVQQDTPWRQQLRYSVEEEAKSNNCHFIFMDYSDEGIVEDGLLMHLITTCGDSGVSGRFRNGVMKTQKFLAEHGILDGRVIWLKGIPDENVQSVLREVAYYADETKHSRQAGTFVVEVRNLNIKVSGKGNIETLRSMEYITSYDTLLFAFIIASQREMTNKNIKTYLAHLSSEIFGYDSEMCYEFLQQFDVNREEPLDGIQKVYDLYKDSGRGVYEFEFTEQHPFYLLTSGQGDLINKRIWKSQVHVLFPFIEQRRIEIIEKWSERLLKCLPIIDTFGTQITELMDVEIGLLSYLLNPYNSTNQIKLEVDQETYHLIKLMASVRNRLAHLDICTSETIMNLFEDGKLSTV
ncbi:hypothetical protein [Proteiniclasticum sp.]|uniref:hypothetical protein n=1 Tax=Proteiniclasticum sp. TaxID=2053595 RepID=UPI00289FD28B|nr:hypothetical protein [Proteiniclasticum sp.]